MEHIQHLAEKIRDRWVANGLKVRPGVSDAELAQFESREGILLPEELCVYLRVVNGMEDWESDEVLLEFFSLDRMAEELSPGPDERCRSLVVVQYSILARVYALHVSSEPALMSPVYGLGEGSESPLFGSFTELLQVYLADPDAVVAR